MLQILFLGAVSFSTSIPEEKVTNERVVSGDAKRLTKEQSGIVGSVRI